MNTEHSPMDLEDRSPMVQREYKAFLIIGAIHDYLIEVEDNAEVPDELFDAAEKILERR